MDDGIKGLLIGLTLGMCVGLVVTSPVLDEVASLRREAIRRNLATYDEQGTFVWKESK